MHFLGGWMFSLLWLCSFISQGWEKVEKHKLTRGGSWVHFDKFTACLYWWSLQSLPCFIFLIFFRSPHFHRVTVKRTVLMDPIVKHSQSTNVIENKIWWEHGGFWLMNRFLSSWYLPWGIYCWFTWTETLAWHRCWSSHKLPAGFWHSVNPSWKEKERK